jgi:hypothetical protein
MRSRKDFETETEMEEEIPKDQVIIFFLLFFFAFFSVFGFNRIV